MNKNHVNRPFRVLALDGGGMRGLYTATVLRALARLMDERFVKEEPDIGKGFDLICGTSTGSILACALAVGVPLHRVCDLYRKNGASIFPSPMPKSDSRLAMGLWILKHSLRPSASSSRLRA